MGSINLQALVEKAKHYAKGLIAGAGAFFGTTSVIVNDAVLNSDSWITALITALITTLATFGVIKVENK